MNDNEKNFERREQELDKRERSLKFREKLILCLSLLNVVLLIFVLCVNWNIFSKKTHYVPEMPWPQQIPVVSNVEKQAKELLNSIERDSTLRKFVMNESLEAIDFAVDKSKLASSYQDMRLFPVKIGTRLVNIKDVIENIKMIAKEDTVKIAEGRKEFRFALRDSCVWDTRIIIKSCLSWNELLPGSGKYTYDSAKNLLSDILRDAETRQGYGYIRFFFKTSLDGVYIMRAYSLDTNERPVDYFCIKSWSQYKITEDFYKKIDQQKKYDGESRFLYFSLLRELPSSVINTLDSCFDEFFSQILSENE